MKLYGRVNGVETEIGGGGASIQVTYLPTASASLVGTIYQYVGTTSPSLGIIHSHFYECASGSTVGTYEWRDVSNFIPVIDNIDDVGDKVVDGTIFYYTGTTTAMLTSGCLYKAMVSETSPGIYGYGYQPVIPMQMDSTPTGNSTNPVTSDGIFNVLERKQNLFEITTDFDLQYKTTVGDIIIWNGTEGNFYKQGHLYRILSHAGGSTQSEEVSPITIDSTPTENSTNPVTSGGVYAALQGAGGGSGNSYGDIKMTACSTAPSGWLICDGSAISRETYSGLFDAIGTTYGTGNGSTTFNIPNLKGRTVFGKSTSTDFNTLGKTGGSTSKTLSTSNMPSHTHTLGSSAKGTFAGATNGGSSKGIRCDGNSIADGVNTFQATVTLSGKTESEGSGSSFSILNPYITLNYIIYTGVTT